MAFDLDARLAEWQRSLLDTTGRNRLIKFASGRGGGLDLLEGAGTSPWHVLIVEGKPLSFPWKRELLGLPAAEVDGTDGQPPAIPAAELTTRARSSPRLRPDHLLTDLSDKKLAAHLLRLSRTAAEAESEQGVSTLYAVRGFLHWYEDDNSQEEFRSPLVLVPVWLTRESAAAPWALQADDDDPTGNHCLAERLAADFRLTLPTDGIDPDEPGEFLGRIRERVAAFPRWRVSDQMALGVFQFQKLAMWQDLKRNADRVKAHGLCRAIAGDPAVTVRVPAGLVKASELDDRVPPAQVNHILDADSSQHEAVEAIKAGADVVVDGPPGTGKSQTIANAIAELLAAGKTVLFVSEKTAALEVVRDRLDGCGLGDFCLELHSHKANKREVLAELNRCLELAGETYPDDMTERRELGELRTQLNAYANELHAPRAALNLSAYRAHGELAQPAATGERTRWGSEAILSHDADFVRKATDVLTRLGECEQVVRSPNTHPWRGCRMPAVTQTGLDDATFHLDRLAGLLGTLSAGDTLSVLALRRPVKCVADWQSAVSFARNTLAVPVVPRTWFVGDPRRAATAAQQLHAVTGKARLLAGKLTEFDPALVAALTPADVGALAAPAGPARELLAKPPASLCSRLTALQDVAGRLRGVLPAAARLEAAAEPAARLMLQAKPPGMAQFGKFAKLGAELAKAPPILPGWWDATRRNELKAVVARAAGELRSAQAIRSKLVARLTPAAFTAESWPVVRDGARLSRTGWRWLSLRWRSVRHLLREWYAGALPTPDVVAADLGELLNYHRQTRYVAEVEASYPDDLARENGRPDWDATATRLSLAEQLEAWNLPSSLKAALAPNGGLDRNALAVASAALAAAWQQFQQLWGELITHYTPPENALRGPVSQLVGALQTDAGAADSESAAIEPLVRLLAVGCDMSAAERSARARHLTELVAARERIGQLAAMLDIPDTPGAVETADWGPHADAAVSLLAFLEKTESPLTSATVSALTDPRERSTVAAAVEVSERVQAGGFAESWAFVAGKLFPADSPVSDGLQLDAAPVPPLASWTAARRADLSRVEEWVRYQRVLREADALGIRQVVDEACNGSVELGRAAAAFRRRFFELWLDAVIEQSPVLRDFVADRHDQLVERFRALDRQSVRLAPLRIRSELLTRASRPRADESAPPGSELGLLRREALKKRRQMPLRKLFAQLPTVLPRLKPCLMMSPLAVSSYLDSPDLRFDVVIFDEASQVRPHDGVCAVYRGNQLVVAGDPRQLPPSDFFERAVEDDDAGDEGDGGTTGFESLLDVALSLGLVRKPLRWHYRSRREALIAFSNKEIYGGTLVTFPGAEDAAGPAVTAVRVPGGVFEGGKNPVEARQVADLVLARLRDRPDRSLGVIAFSRAQQTCIEDELDARRRDDPDAAAVLRAGDENGLFVKNLENVQGDERDDIVLSVGYGPDPLGKVAMRFGPLNRQGGERRLNVAVTRARHSMTVASSLGPADLDLSRTSAEGVRLLRAFLDYAQRGPAALAAAITGVDASRFDSPFELEVCEALHRNGLTVHPQVGCGGFSVDLGIVDPGKPGRYLLGVECDGASYHSSATARDRDRLRQSVLEGLGWRLVRIWSTDWVRNRDRQVQRVLAAVAAAATPAPPPPPPAPTSVAEPTPVPVPRYAKIDDVPSSAAQSALLTVLGDYGITEYRDVLKAASSKLGFQKLGSKIEGRLGGELERLIQRESITRHDGARVGLSPIEVGQRTQPTTR